MFLEVSSLYNTIYVLNEACLLFVFSSLHISFVEGNSIKRSLGSMSGHHA